MICFAQCDGGYVANKSGRHLKLMGGKCGIIFDAFLDDEEDDEVVAFRFDILDCNTINSILCHNNQTAITIHW
tara:strand:+ start:792 stop:1010 length:219 start_codon:yes stop_codon:yes gene_type:complete